MKSSSSPKRPSRLLTDQELALYSLEHFFSMCSAWYDSGVAKDVIATCDLLVRDRPPHRNFLLAGGLEAIVNFLLNLHYEEDQIAYLLKYKRISEGFADYLRTFRFTGDVLAMPEGTVHFPGEPMIRITAPLIEANLITDQLIALATTDTMLLSKIARVRIAAQDRFVGIGFVRAQGIDTGWRAGRNTMLFENCNISNAAIGMRLGTTSPVINANHAFIKSFPTEQEAMRTICERFPAAPMIDTYDAEQGIRNAVQVANELRAKGKKMIGIVIDSGDYVALSKKARKAFDAAGHHDIRISVTGNLDEYRIEDFIKRGITANAFLVVTEIVTNADSPKLEMVYKLAETRKGKEIHLAAKLAPKKVSLPGRKQIFRRYGKNGQLLGDTIAFETEKVAGSPLLKAYIRNGKQVRALPNQTELRKYITSQLKTLPKRLERIRTDEPSPLRVSRKLTSALAAFRKIKKAERKG